MWKDIAKQQGTSAEAAASGQRHLPHLQQYRPRGCGLQVRVLVCLLHCACLHARLSTAALPCLLSCRTLVPGALPTCVFLCLAFAPWQYSSDIVLFTAVILPLSPLLRLCVLDPPPRIHSFSCLSSPPFHDLPFSLLPNITLRSAFASGATTTFTSAPSGSTRSWGVASPSKRSGNVRWRGA